MLTHLTAGVAFLASFAAAYTTPTGSAPEGNAILTPGLDTVVTAGQDYTVTWDPSTHGTVSLVLLKGPSSNAVPQYAIVEKIENSGSYTWAVKDDLEPSDGTTGYGLQLIDDSTGQYQYSTQFGISNPGYEGASSSSSSSAGGSASGYISATSSETASTSASTWSSTITSSASVAPSSSETASAVTVSSSWYPVSNSTITQTTSQTTLVIHTTTGTKTSSTKSTSTSASASAPAETNAAGNVATSFAGLVIAAGVAVLAI